MDGSTRVMISNNDCINLHILTGLNNIIRIMIQNNFHCRKADSGLYLEMSSLVFSICCELLYELLPKAYKD
jgi:hypothetical protein